MSELDRLSDEQKAAVKTAIDLARKSPGQHTVHCSDGSEAYASRDPGGGIRWGVNGGHYGWCLARGIAPSTGKEASMSMDDATARQLAAHWQHFTGAPTDGTSVLAFGIHAEAAPPGASPQVRPGDYWWAIIQFDIWRSAEQGGRRWVFCKDGRPPWSEPLYYMPLPAAPYAIALCNPAPSDRREI